MNDLEILSKGMRDNIGYGKVHIALKHEMSFRNASSVVLQQIIDITVKIL